MSIWTQGGRHEQAENPEREPAGRQPLCGRRYQRQRNMHHRQAQRLGTQQTVAVVRVDGLRKTYGEGIGVQEVSFDVDRGEIFGIIGPNGAGKTTTVECVCGMRIPDSGVIDVLGLDPQANRAAIREYVGVQLQGRSPAIH